MLRTPMKLALVVGLSIGVAYVAGPEIFQATGRLIQESYAENEPNALRLKRVEVMIEELESVALANQKASAEYTIRSRRISEQIASDAEEWTYLDGEVRAASRLINLDLPDYTFNGQVYSRNEVIGEANRKAMRALALDKRREHNEDLLESLASATVRLNRQHGELQGEISTLKGELESLEILMETVNLGSSTAVHIAGMDDSVLERANQLMDAVRADLEVTQELISTSRDVESAINFTDETSSPKMSALDRYISHHKPQ